MNAALGQGLGSGIAAVTISFGVGFLVLMTVVVLSGEAGHFAKAGSVNRWLLLSRCFGAFYVWAIMWSIPALGVVTAISAMILGQLIVALVLDASGSFRLQAIQVSPQRIMGVLLVAGGLVLSKL